MKTDVQIAQNATMQPITVIADQLGLSADDLELYGNYKAKIHLDVTKRLANRPDGRLILVTAINPTPAGEGKTTTNVGLSMALNHLGKKTITALREPSLGPCFGIKGGAAGGGYAQVVPMDDINLHFTGDIHAVTAANNLLAAMIDNSLHQGNPLQINPKEILWRRAVDINDRSLRQITIGLGSKANGVARPDGFDISVASEIMAILCLATDMADLKQRLSSMVIGYTYDRRPVTAGQLEATGALTLLLRDAMMPNLVQTLENTPAIIHGGPFANIAHGCNSVIATKMALKLADYVITEAGFGADLGAEKFFNIKCPSANLQPSATVIVATVRALKNHGGVDKEALSTENLEALAKGFANLEKHIDSLNQFDVPVIVAINTFPSDSDNELAFIENACAKLGVEVARSDVFAKGGQGGLELAKKVIALTEQSASHFHPLYPPTLSPQEKIEQICQKIYGASGVDFSDIALKNLSQFMSDGFTHLPICMAKTQYSLSDNPKLIGRPTDFRITIRDVKLSAGAGFLVALAGNIMRMPGLPKKPAATQIDLLDNGQIVGLF